MVHVGDLHRGRRRAERRRPRRRSSQPRLYRQPIRRAERTHRPHLLHAGQHDSDDRADPRSAAHEPVRPHGVADEDGFRQGPAARGQLQAVDARAEPDPAEPGRRSERRPTRTDSPAVKALRAAWLQKKAQIFAGKLTKPDSEDPDTVNHFNWYMSTGFTRPYPGEKVVRPPSEFNNPAPAGDGDDD